MTRQEFILERLEQTASRGLFGEYVFLYPSEANKIQKQWKVEVLKLSKDLNEKGQKEYLLKWGNAFPRGLNYKQSWYISRLTDEMPAVEDISQRLFLISARV